MRIAVIINPIAGRRGSHAGEAERRLALVRREAARWHVEPRIEMTTGPGHATALAADCVRDGCDVVVAMGGDGTVNEVAHALIDTPAALAILPCGSGDGLAFGLGLPRDPVAAFAIAVQGRTMAMDVGYLNDRPFLNVAGIGFDAAVGEVFSRRKTRGVWGYIVSAVGLVWRYEAPHYDINLDGVRRSGRKFLIGFANSPQYGNGATLAPSADVQDGYLDVLIADAGSPWSQIWRARRLYWRQSAPARGIERFRVTTATVDAPHIIAHLDGEVWNAPPPAHVRIKPRALNVRVP